MTDIEEIYSAVSSLPLTDRLRLVERVVHDAVAASKKVTPIAEGARSMIGLFAESPELIDEVCRLAMEDRTTRR
jgi:hypothetical protein